MMVTGMAQALKQSDLVRDALREAIHGEELLEMLPMAIYVVDLQGAIQFYNQHAAKIWGREPQVGEEISPGGGRLRFPQADGTTLSYEATPLAQTLRDGLPRTNLKAIQERPSGGHVSVLANIAALRSHDGDVIGAMVCMQDQTPQKAMESELTAAKGAAVKGHEAKDRFLAALSHELRTPLMPVLIVASAWEQDPSVMPALRDDLAMIRRNIEQEARLIDDLLDLTRLSRGKNELQCREVEVHELLSQAISTTYFNQIKSHHMRIEKNYQAQNSRVWGDAARLVQIFWNLLKNAVKFSPEGGLIRVQTFNTDHAMHVRVSDTGIGIPPGMLPGVFEALEGDETTGRAGGVMGVGLAIARLLVELHGGKIRAESDGIGRGSVFTVELPLLRQAGH